MTNGMNVANKTVLITGANRGIGRALVNEALKRGAKRVYAATRAPMQIADERVTLLTLDVTNASQIQRAVGQVGVLDVLVNNAGVAAYDDLTNPDVVEQHLAINLFGPLRVTNAFVPLLKRSKGAIYQQSVIGRTRCAADDTRLFHFEGGRLQHDAVSASAPRRRRRFGPCGRARPHRHGDESRSRYIEGFSGVRGGRHLRRSGEG